MDFKTYYIIFHDPLWVMLLASALFFPIRKFIWVLYVRRKQKKDRSVSEEEKKILKKKHLSRHFSYLLFLATFM